MSRADTRNKTVLIATYPDGHRIQIVRVSGLGWQWERGSYSSHQDSAKAQAREAGATLTREPNPNYRPRLGTFERLMKGTR